MSDGERTALFLILRVLSANSDNIIVDEPEVHFHPLLARAIWNELERQKPKCRFVYITHDIPFALSRRDPVIFIARSPSQMQRLDAIGGLPGELVQRILGAATFSVNANRLVFCEGTMTGLDYRILSAWYSDDNSKVIPVGSCLAVKECVSVFRSGRATVNVDAVGHIDRDRWPVEFLSDSEWIRPLPVHEIEGLFCISQIFAAFGAFYGFPESQVSEKHIEFVAKAKGKFSGATLNKEILDRSKIRAEFAVRGPLNAVKPDKALTITRAQFQTAALTAESLGAIFDEESSHLQSALACGVEPFLAAFPSKTYWTEAASALGVSTETLVKDFARALALPAENAGTEASLNSLRVAIVDALTPHFWARSIS
jgi:hypothetical protein